MYNKSPTYKTKNESGYSNRTDVTQTVSKNAAFEAAYQSKHHAHQARPPRAKF